MNDLVDRLAVDDDAVSVEWDGLVALVTIGDDSFDIVSLDGSYQIRQIVVENDAGYDAGVEANLLELMSRLNNRFTCCKFSFDLQRNVVTSCDIPSSVATTSFIREMLDQVHFLSGAAADLASQVIGGHSADEADIDRAFELPSPS